MQTISKINRREVGRRRARYRWEVIGHLPKREPGFHEIRLRALHDAKGAVELEGCSYRKGRAFPWAVVRSVNGAVDQVDFIFNGRLVFTGGRRLLRKKYPWLRVSESDSKSPLNVGRAA